MKEDNLSEDAEMTASASEHTGVLTVKTANEWMKDASKRQDPKVYFHGLIVERENTVLFASSNVGKSILAVQLAVDIAKTDKVLYVDLELSDKQFEMRYKNPETGKTFSFSDNFMRAELDPELIGGVDLEKEILNSIKVAAEKGIRFVIVDNLTFLCHDAEKSAVATEFMLQLIQLKKMYELTTIVIAHTPKRRGYEPITQNDLAGSSKLISFFDAGIAMARSARDYNLRYLKQVKVRTGEYKYDDDSVILLDLVMEDCFLHFKALGREREVNLLKQGDPSKDVDEILDILRLQKQGKSLREIAKELGITLGKVQRRLIRAKKEKISLPVEATNDDSSVSPVSDVEGPIQPIQPIRDSPDSST